MSHSGGQEMFGLSRVDQSSSPLIPRESSPKNRRTRRAVNCEQRVPRRESPSNSDRCPNQPVECPSDVEWRLGV